MYFKDSFDVYFYREFLYEKRNLKESTMKKYCDCVQRFLSDKYDPENIDDYNKFMIKHTIKKRTTYFYSAMKAYIEYKITDVGLRASMIENLIKPEIPKSLKTERKYLDEEQIIQIINNLRKKKHKIIALIQDLTGVRAGDVLKIKRGNIQPEIYEDKPVLKIIVEGKGGKRNVVFIHDEIVQKLIVNFLVKNFISSDYYFLDERKRAITNTFPEEVRYKSNYKKYYVDLKSALYAVGLSSKDFGTHDYRRCYARRVWTKYKDLHVLQELLNHANPATTMRYLQQSGLQNIEYHKQMQND